MRLMTRVKRLFRGKQNCGIEIYNALKEGFDKNFSGGEMIFEGEKNG